MQSPAVAADPRHHPVPDRGSYKLVVLDPRTERDRVRRAWQAFQGALTHEYFLSWGLIDTWLDWIADSDGVEVKLVAGFRDDTPVLAFFAGISRSVRNGIVPVLSIAVNATAQRRLNPVTIEYNRILTSQPLGGRVWDLLDELDRLFDWDEIVLPGFDARAEPASLLESCPDRWRVLVIRDEPSPCVDLTRIRETAGGYLALLSRNARGQMRRCYRAYEAAGGAGLRAAEDVGEALAIFDELVQLHQAAWTRKGMPGSFGRERVLAFHRDLIRRRFESGEVQLLRVTAGSEVVGCLYNFVWNGHVLFYQGGMSEPADKRMKPGWLCHCEAISYNASRGCTVYDFLAGDSQYKNSLSTDRQRMIWVVIQKRKLRFALEGAGRAVKQYLRSRRGRK